MAGFSTSTSTGSSSSTPTLMDNQYSQWGMQLSKMLAALGQNQYNWAMGQYNKGAAITDQNIAQQLQIAGMGKGLAQSIISNYNDVFQPLITDYAHEAETYSSEGRMRFAAGAAASTVGQADTQAMNEAERNLRSFGVSPDSGRYDALRMTGRIQDAAARAGAGTQAALDTANTGRQMKLNAAQMGQNEPGIATNAANLALGATTSAENSILGMLNTGANLTQSAAPFFNAASGAIKMPPVGNTSQQQSRSNSNQTNTDPAQAARSGGGGSGPGGGGSGGGGRGNGMFDSPYSPLFDQGQFGGGQQGAIGDPRFTGSPGGAKNQTIRSGSMAKFFKNDDAEPPGFGNGDYSPDQSSSGMGYGSATGLDPQDQYGTAMDEGYGGSQDFGQYGQQDYGQNYTDYNPQDYSNQDYGGFDAGGQNYSDYGGSTGQFSYDDPYAGGNYTDYGGGGSNDYSGFDAGGQNYTDYGGGGGGGGYDYGGGGDTSGWGGDYEYARGGPVPPPSQGGHVSPNQSPTRGRATDDVPARLNVGEFVMPRDVVAHKGQEFFQNVINKSRRARTGMSGPPAQAKMKPALNQRPTFVSRGA